jgi:hypothetical protein
MAGPRRQPELRDKTSGTAVTYLALYLTGWRETFRFVTASST